MIPDTNVWSELTRRPGNPQVLDWLDQHNSELLLSVVVIAEVRAGVEGPNAGIKRAGLEMWLETLEQEYGERILPFDEAAAHVLGKLLLAKPQQNKMLDTLLAAQALSRDCPIATRNVKDFEWTGAKLLNPWEA
jgi:toxin FitB